jgi:hypothetical protein
MAKRYFKYFLYVATLIPVGRYTFYNKMSTAPMIYYELSSIKNLKISLIGILLRSVARRDFIERLVLSTAIVDNCRSYRQLGVEMRKLSASKGVITA